MADQTPETPEALARAVLYGDVDLEQSADLIRTRDAALIAQHTAELTATAQRHLEERDHYRGCYLEMVTTREHIADLKAQLATAKQERTDAVKTLLGLALTRPVDVDAAEQSRHLAAALDLVASYKHQTEELAERAAELTARLEAANAISRSRLRGLDEAHEHITSLEAQLTASAQREASARAEGREAALREAFGVVVVAFQGEAHERHPALFRAYCAIADRLLKLTPPPPRVDTVPPETLEAQLRSAREVALRSTVIAVESLHPELSATPEAFKESAKCSSCNGRGLWGGDMTCPRCGGTGTAESATGGDGTK